MSSEFSLWLRAGFTMTKKQVFALSPIMLAMAVQAQSAAVDNSEVAADEDTSK